MEINELLEETCVREVKEETGYDIQIIKLLRDFHNYNKTWPNGDKAHVICFVYYAKIIGGTRVIDGDETLDLRYFSPDDLPEIDAIDHLEAIRYYYGIK